MRATAFVSGPYYSPNPQKIATNIQNAQECAAWLWEHNYYVFCPHLNTRHFEALTTQPEHVFVDFCFKLLRSGLVDLVVLLPNHKNSPGSNREVNLALKLGIPVIMWNPQDGLTKRLD